MSIKANIRSLPVREAAVDPIYRTVLSLDTNDLALFESAMYPDAIFDLNGSVMEGVAAIRAGCYDRVNKLDTTHFLSNVRLNLSPCETKASITASALAQHFRAGEGNTPNTAHLTSGSLYFVDVAKDDKDGLWKIKSWRMKLIWTEGDWAVMGN